jgi:hypothetical protein
MRQMLRTERRADAEGAVGFGGRQLKLIQCINTYI